MKNPTYVSWICFISGAIAALWSAGVTALLLLVNGSLTLAVLTSVSEGGPEWLGKPGVTQFLLFSIPLVMTVCQWMIWDVASGILARRVSDGS